MKTFGGYFPLELPVAGSHYYPDARTYRSARSALFHLLTTVHPSRLWLPRLICQSVIDAVMASGVEISWYSLDETYCPRLTQPVGNNDFLLYVDYLGHCQAQKEKVRAMFPSDRIIFDHSQAFFAHQAGSLANLYSPRKFFGVADGGLLDTQALVPVPATQDHDSLSNSTHLLLQHEFDTRSGYSHFQQAEAALGDINATGMSCLTDRILRSADYEHVKTTRERNYQMLRERLDDLNDFPFTDDTVSGPFCYPFYFTARPLQQALIARGVFVATYWREVLERVDADSVEANFVNYMVPLPCDQRYSEEDIQQLSDIVRSVVADNPGRSHDS